MQDDASQDEPGFLQRYRVVLILGAVVLIGGVGFFAFGGKPAPKKKASVSMVNIMPPPPPPPAPTPPPTPPPQEQPPPPDSKQPEFQPEDKPEEAPPQPQAAPDEPAPMGSNIQGDGSDGFGLVGRGSGMIGGTGKGKGGGGTKWGWYAGQVQSRVMDALSKHRHTRSAKLSVKVRIWADSNGRITRAVLDGSTGNRDVDQAIQTEILAGLQLQEPPPSDMPMPIVMRITAKRPN